MRYWESWVLAYLLNSLWQVPLVFCAAWVAVRVARPNGVKLEHRIWVSALLLEGVLPLCHFHPEEWLAWAMSMLRGGGAHGGSGQVLVDVSATRAGGAMGLSASMQGAIVVAYLIAVLYFGARLLWRLWATRRVLWRAEETALADEDTRKLELCREVFGIGAPVRVATLAELPSPATVGVRRHTLLLPVDFAEQVGEGDMDVVLAHECAHMRRQDFAKNLLYEFLSVAVQYHPMLALTRAGLAETRELVCDEMALDALPGRENYARSLLRLASMLAGRTAPRLLHAIGILDANIFERRIMNLTRKMRTPGTARRLLAAAACGLIAVVTCISALALQTDVPAQSAKSGGPVEVKPGEMVNNLITKVAPVYPPEAKAAKVQGTVVLDATIGKDGHMENLRVESGPAMLQQSSMDAVRNWVYKPYLLNGEPVVVQTKINVIYTLDKHSGGKKATKN